MPSLGTSTVLILLCPYYVHLSDSITHKSQYLNDIPSHITSITIFFPSWLWNAHLPSGYWLLAVIDGIWTNQNSIPADDRLQRELPTNSRVKGVYPLLFMLLSSTTLGSSDADHLSPVSLQGVIKDLAAICRKMWVLQWESVSCAFPGSCVSKNSTCLKPSRIVDARRGLRFHHSCRSYGALYSRHFIAAGPRGLLFLCLETCEIHEFHSLVVGNYMHRTKMRHTSRHMCIVSACNCGRKSWYHPTGPLALMAAMSPSSTLSRFLICDAGLD